MATSKVLWGGGFVSGNPTDLSITYLNPLSGSDQNAISGALYSRLIDSSGNPKQVDGLNFTDADVYVLGSDSVVNLYKSPCTAKMKCTYNTSYNKHPKLFTNNSNIWYASFDDGKFVVASDYLRFNNEGLRMKPNSGSNSFYKQEFEFQNSIGTAEYAFTESAFTSNQTNDRMFKDCTDLLTCEIPCEMRVISQNTFNGCTSLTSYTRTPKFITEINEGAFNGCTSLPTLLIPEFSNIGKNAFKGCTAATSITWNGLSANTASSKYNCGQISDGAFENCTSLSESEFDDGTVGHIVIPSGITTIGNNAFYNCNSIRDLDMKSVTTIGTDAFNGCTSLTGITGMSNVTTVGARAFENVGNRNMTDTMGNLSGLTSIGDGAFSGVHFSGGISLNGITGNNIGYSSFENATIEGNVEIPNSGVTLSEHMFENATINGNVICNAKNIGSSAFCNSNISSITLNNTKIIGDEAFGDCHNLTSITIPNSVSAISGYAFNNCTSLTSITINATTPPNLGSNVFDGSTCPIYVPCESINDYKTATNWSYYESRIYGYGCETRVVAKFNVTSTTSSTKIASATTNFSKIEIDGVEQPSVVSAYTFSTLGEHTVKYTLADPTSIGGSTFNGCSRLTSIGIPNSVTTIGDYAFYACFYLSSCTIGNGVTSIGTGAFARCNRLNSITFNGIEPPPPSSVDTTAFDNVPSGGTLWVYNDDNVILAYDNWKSRVGLSNWGVNGMTS